MDSIQIETRRRSDSWSNSDGALKESKSKQLDADSPEIDENENDYGTTGFVLPQLKDSMIPWRAGNRSLMDKKGNTNNLVDGMSPLNSRPETRNSLLSLDGARTVTSSSVSNEVDHLQRQLTTYKLKVRALLELIKQFSYMGDDLEDNNNISSSFYHKLLSAIAQNDDVEGLKTQMHHLEIGSDSKTDTIEQLREQLSEMESHLKQTKEEYSETLEYANEYIGLNEQITTCINGLLGLLIENSELSQEEVKTLEDARMTSPEFAMAKMNTLSVTLTRILKDLNEKNASENGQLTVTTNSARVESRNESALASTQFQKAIEGIHEYYDNFIRSMQAKLDKSFQLESTLSGKLSQQNELLRAIEDESKNSDRFSISSANEFRKSNTSLPDIADLGKPTMADLSKSYHEHVDGLTQLVQTLRSSITEKSQELAQLKIQLQNQSQLLDREQRSRQDLKILEDLTKQKEKTWEELVNNLEESIGNFQLEKQAMVKDNDELRTENAKLDGTLEKEARKIESYQEQIDQLIHELSAVTEKLVDLKEENSSLHKMVFNGESSNKTIYRHKSEFTKFQAHLLLHLENIFKTLSKILQKKSIDQSKRKLEILHQMNDISQMRNMQPKLESLYNFIETALESIVESYMMVIATEKDKSHRVTGHEGEMQLRIEELERKWVSERERRKLDSNAAEAQISKLESENESLREKLYNMTIR